MIKESYLRGDICMVDFGKNVGSVQSGIRPALIIQNDVGNKFSTTLIVIPITSKNKGNMPTHYEIYKDNYNFLRFDSVVICEQLLTISKEQVKRRMGVIKNADLVGVEAKLLFSLGVKVSV